MSLMRKMWFGTKQFSRWIKVQSPDSTPGMAGASDRIDYGNGGVALRESINGHMEYALTWNRLTQREAREITDFAYGLYGSDLLYLSEPSATGQNALNKAWSAPGLTAKDGIPLAGDVRPTLVKNFDQSQDYPVDMAQYQIGESTPRRSFYVPVPPGHTAWVGAHGDAASTSGLSVQPTVRGTAAGAPSILGVMSVDTPQRFNGSFPAAGEQAGIELSLEPATSITNLATNPSFESLTTPVAGMTWANDGTITTTQSTIGVRSGVYSLQLSRTTGAAGGYQYLGISSLPAGTYTVIIPAYLASPQVGPSAAARTIEYRIGSTVIAASTPFPNAAGSYEMRLTFVKTAAVATHLLMIHVGAPAGSDLWIDDFTLVAGAYSGPAFTGRSPGAAWTGAIDASTSTLSTRTCTLAGVMVQVLPTGETPVDGPFISGQGAGGLEFEGRVQAVPYSLAHDSFGLAVKLTETEDWK
jgi:hypothetical protein